MLENDDRVHGSCNDAGGVAHRLARAKRERDSSITWEMGHQSLPGESQVWTSILAIAGTQLLSRQPVLILGESGTGRSSLAKAMHAGGGLPDDECVLLDCAGSGKLLLERFAGAIENDWGTVVLQHIDALASATARALAAQLETHIVTGARPRVMATGLPMDSDCRDPALQRLLDLLGAVRLDLPALRARSEDVPDLVAQISQRHAGVPSVVSRNAMMALERAPWPGNVRQLETVVRNVATSARGREITVEMLPSEIGVYSKRRYLTAIEQVELEAILSALALSRGNKVLAARALGISRSTLYRKMTSYLLDPDRSFF